MDLQKDIDKYGKNVKYYRKKFNLTQAQLAELTNLSTNYIGMIERGKRNIKLDKILKIANSLNTPVSKFFEENK